MRTSFISNEAANLRLHFSYTFIACDRQERGLFLFTEQFLT
jgi:hypothetical protein